MEEVRVLFTAWGTPLCPSFIRASERLTPLLPFSVCIIRRENSLKDVLYQFAVIFCHGGHFHTFVHLNIALCRCSDKFTTALAFKV
jgi:hypothetical protein